MGGEGKWKGDKSSEQVGSGWPKIPTKSVDYR